MYTAESLVMNPFTTNRIVFNLFLVLFILMPVMVLSFYFLADDDSDAYLLSDWYYTDNTVKDTSVELPKRMTISIGASCEIQQDLPASLVPDMLFVFTQMQDISVYLEDEQIYQSSSEGSPVYFCWHAIEIPPSDESRSLRVCYTKTHFFLGGHIEPVLHGTAAAPLVYVLKRYIPYLLQCCLLLLAGILSIVFGFFHHSVRRHIKEARTSQRLGALLIDIALLNMLTLPVTGLLCTDGQFLSAIAVFLLVLIPLLLILVFTSLTVSDDFRLEERNFIFVYLLLIAACLRLSLSGKADPFAMVFWFILLIPVFLIYVFFFGIAELQSSHTPEYRRNLYSELLNTVLIGLIGCALLSTLYFIYSYSSVEIIIPLAGTIILLHSSIWLAMINLILRETRLLWHVEEALEQSRMTLMLSQIKPHFMYNTLNSIRALIRQSPKKADDLVYHFSCFLHDNMVNISSTDPIPFSAELSHIREYISIEQAVYSKLQVHYDINVHSFLVPPLSIQPLVENAIKHGIRHKVDGGELWLRSYDDDRYYYVDIIDNGVGFNTDQLSNAEGSFGIHNVRMRLAYYCNAELSIESMPGKGTSVYVTIPKGNPIGKTGLGTSRRQRKRQVVERRNYENNSGRR